VLQLVIDLLPVFIRCTLISVPSLAQCVPESTELGTKKPLPHLSSLVQGHDAFQIGDAKFYFHFVTGSVLNDNSVGLCGTWAVGVEIAASCNSPASSFT
jgi:hypothetical protein